MQLNKLVGAIRAKMDWHAVEDVMVGDSQIARVRYWLNNDPERGGIGFVAEQWCFDDQMWLIIGDQYGTPDEAKDACEQHVTCLLLGMVELDDALTQTHMRIGNITFHPNVMVQSVLDCAAREYERRKDEKGYTSGLQALRDGLKAQAQAGGLQPPEVQGFVQGSPEWTEAIEASNLKVQQLEKACEQRAAHEYVLMGENAQLKAEIDRLKTELQRALYSANEWQRKYNQAVG